MIVDKGCIYVPAGTYKLTRVRVCVLWFNFYAVRRDLMGLV